MPWAHCSLEGVGPETSESARSRNETIVLSLVIGVLVGLVTVAFILLTGRLAARMYPSGGAPWRRLLIPVLGSLGTGYLLSKYFPNARGSGIPQAKYALFINNGYISLKTVIGKFVCCAASLASGIALGREGPSVQIGAGISSVLGRRFRLTTEDVKSLVPVGCSAALAAAFNTPIAAVLFSLEEIMGDMHAPVLGTVVIASATSWMVLHLVLGDQPLFHVPAYQLVNPAEFGDLRDSGRGRRVGIGVLRQTSAGHPQMVQDVSQGDRMGTAGGRRVTGRPDRMVRTGGSGRRLRLRRCCAGRRFSGENRRPAWLC